MVQIDIQKFAWAMRCGSTLPLPLHRKRLHQSRQRNLLRLPPVQDRLDDIWRQQREPQKARDIGRVDLLGRGQFVDRAVAPSFQHPAPSECTGQCLHQRGVGRRGRLRFLFTPPRPGRLPSAW